ncbi:hypothetical protein E4V01_05430 [Methylorubrum sp. Q1]|nr:hypothetical protein E4V01_05430 [Methylorubrum sp. Q1]
MAMADPGAVSPHEGWARRTSVVEDRLTDESPRPSVRHRSRGRANRGDATVRKVKRWNSTP